MAKREEGENRKRLTLERNRKPEGKYPRTLHANSLPPNGATRAASRRSRVSTPRSIYHSDEGWYVPEGILRMGLGEIDAHAGAAFSFREEPHIRIGTPEPFAALPADHDCEYPRPDSGDSRHERALRASARSRVSQV